ncbi:MAG: response regulator [Oscillospiraceae bacterium]|nr:response regulator [Oscillospiraceae bacterium]
MITESTFTKEIMNLTGDELSDYVGILDNYVDAFPERAKKLKIALDDGNHDGIIAGLTAMQEMLLSIRAEDMAEECLDIIKVYHSVKFDKVESYVVYLLSNMSTLSIDMQLSMHRTNKKKKFRAKTESVDFPEASETKNLDDEFRYSEDDEPEITEEIMGEGKSDRVREDWEPWEPDADTFKSILVVDDSAFFLNAMRTTLKDSPYKATFINSGASALKYLKSHSVDLIILDIEMPFMDGYELAKKIKENRVMAPIIFLTGNAEKSYVVKAIQAGAVDFILKPIDKNLVLNKIAKYIVV